MLWKLSGYLGSGGGKKKKKKGILRIKENVERKEGAGVSVALWLSSIDQQSFAAQVNPLFQQRAGRKRACHVAQTTTDKIIKIIFIQYHKITSTEMELPWSKPQTQL